MQMVLAEERFMGSWLDGLLAQYVRYWVKKSLAEPGELNQKDFQLNYMAVETTLRRNQSV